MHGGRTAAPAVKASGFLLSVLSPVWRAKLCGNIGGEATRWQLELGCEEAGLFRKLMALGSGAVVTMEGGLEGAMGLGLMADRYQVEAVQGAVEESVVRLLTVERCGGVLARSSGSGLVRVEWASRELALRSFDDFARTAGFMEVGEEALGSLLEDDGLWTEGEERVFEGVVRWMKGGEGGEVRGSRLLGKVRFPLMEDGYLADLLQQGSEELAGLAELVGEAVGLKSVGRDEWGRQLLRHLDGSAVVGRRGGVRWQEFVGGGERRLDTGRIVWSVAADGGYVCAGLSGGSIRVWSRSTLEPERTLTGHTSAVSALLFVEGRLVSGSYDSRIRVWNVGAGQCEGVLDGHRGCVTSLALCGNRLVSGSNDKTVRVWRMEGEASSWQCDQILVGNEEGVCCLAAQGDKVAGGWRDGSIRVWSSETWALVRTLRGHDKTLWSVAFTGRGLISSAGDGTVRVWSIETGECVQTVEVYSAGSGQYIRCLAVCGSTLVGGSCGGSSSEEGEVRVWDLQTLRPLHILRQPVGWDVRSLVWDGRGVWGAVGEHAVVWGRRG